MAQTNLAELMHEYEVRHQQRLENFYSKLAAKRHAE